MTTTLKKKIAGIYLITDEEARLVERVAAALSGPVSVLQYRAKTASDQEKVATGTRLRELCRTNGVTFIVNDDLELARLLDADGLHLGQEDGDCGEARAILDPGKIIGISTHDREEALAAEAAGADYIGFGAMYPTGSKEVRFLPGPELLASVRGAVSIPVAAIGGITSANADRVVDGGADALAVISSLLADPDPGVAAAELALSFNRRKPAPAGTVLTVAGSDSGGGAGIQADIKTITLLGSYAASVITAITAQNTTGVTAVEGASPAIVTAQLEAVLSDIPIDVIKTGMLYSGEIADLVAGMVHAGRKRIVVADPVLVAKGGARLMDGAALAVVRQKFLPCVYLLTPNIPEAEWLTGSRIRNEGDMERAAKELQEMGARNVLVKGGHLEKGDAVDLLWDGRSITRFAAPRRQTMNTHGTGCTYSSAIAALLAQGIPLKKAVTAAKAFITAAIGLAGPLGRGHGPVNHFLAAQHTGDREPEPRDR